MSFRTGLYVFASGLIALVLFILSVGFVLEYKKRHAYERNDASQYHANATQHSVSACGAVMDESGVVDWLVCLAENVSADGGVKHAEYDLKAQQDMAEWAFGMLLATIWVAVITLFGVIFVWRTLIATRETVEVTKESSRDQGRAYVQLDAVQSKSGSVGGSFEGIIMNFGNTPCEWYDVSYAFVVVLKPKEGVPKPPNISDFKMEESVKTRYSCLGPNQPMALQMGPKKGSNFSFNHTTQNLFLMANIRYMTIYDEICETGTCFILDRKIGFEMKRISMDLPAYQKQ